MRVIVEEEDFELLRRLVAEKDIRITALELTNTQLIRELETAQAALNYFESTDSTISNLVDKFDTWTNDLREMPQRSLADLNILPLMIAQRPAHVSRCFEFTSTPLVMTKAEYPFRIIHANGAWSKLCGWENHEVAGTTLAFLHGAATDREEAADLCCTAAETGYGVAEIINYRKDGNPFKNRIALIPVFSNTESPVLTNFLALLDAIELSDDESADAATFSDSLHRADNPSRPPLSESERVLVMTPFTGLQSLPLHMISAYMVLTDEALCLTNHLGRICSVNRQWVELCGYTLSEVEGHTCKLLQGPETRDLNDFDARIRKHLVAEAVLTNFRKDGSSFRNCVTVLPIVTDCADMGLDRRPYFLARLREVKGSAEF